MGVVLEDLFDLMFLGYHYKNWSKVENEYFGLNTGIMISLHWFGQEQKAILLDINT